LEYILAFVQILSDCTIGGCISKLTFDFSLKGLFQLNSGLSGLIYLVCFLFNTRNFGLISISAPNDITTTGIKIYKTLIFNYLSFCEYLLIFYYCIIVIKGNSNISEKHYTIQGKSYIFHTFVAVLILKYQAFFRVKYDSNKS
jgi:hypothetical protein